MVSDDTEHTCFVGQALLDAAGDPDVFEQSLARHLRLWLLGGPAGIGLATLKATMRLCVGVPRGRSGIRSAGNGPAMRSALIGVCYGDNPEVLVELVRRSTRITHTDPKAEVGALAVAAAAHLAATAARVSADAFCSVFMDIVAVGRGHSRDVAQAQFRAAVDEFLRLIALASASADKGEDASAFAESLGLRRGVTGYVYHTVPAVLQVLFRRAHDFQGGVIDVILAGGDTDSTAAIAGALIGARVGANGIPKPWLEDLWEWPRSVEWMRRLGTELARLVDGDPTAGVPVHSWQVPIRNSVFAATVLAHALRRMLPPY